MTNKRYFLFAGIVAFIGLVGVSCSIYSENYRIATLTPVTQTPVVTQPPTDIPTPTLLTTFTPNPLFTITPSPTAVPPYPTASVVKANAVAFIARDNINPLDTSLWVANVDGSGEKKLVDIIYNKDSYDYPQEGVQWSPDGKWISYFSQDKLWAVSRDGLTKKSLLSLPVKSVAYLIRYAWSPDSSKIAYLELSYSKPTITPTLRPQGGDGIAIYLVGIIDVATENVSELPLFEANAGIPILLWSPNGRDLLFIKDYSLVLFDVAANKIVKSIKRGCGLERGLSWSPNGRWFSYTDNGVGGFNATWICVNSATGGLLHKIYVDSTSFNPIWDKTGNYIYFLAAKIDLTRKSDLLIDERLMRYDVRTQKTESLLSLKEPQQLNSYNYRQSVSISPDGRTLETHTQILDDQQSYILMDLESLVVEKFTSNFGCKWSTDSQNFICLSESNGYSVFHRMDIHTRETSIISGEHLLVSWAISPIAITL